MANPKLPQLLTDARRQGWAKWIRNVSDEKALLNGCYFDPRTADRVVSFFPRFLCHSSGEWFGKPFHLLDWQADDLIRPLFGWKRKDGTRRYRKAYVEIPKKNGKSTIAAGVGLYLLAGDNEPGAKVFSAASDQKQAKIVHEEAIHMVEASPELRRALKINRSTNTISWEQLYASYCAISKAPHNKEGFNAHGIIADELHVWHGRGLWDALKYAFRARRQGLLFMITTAGDDMTSVCREQHDYAVDVLKGTRTDDRFFGYIRAADVDDDITKPEIWRKANPSMGITIKEDEFAADLAEATSTPAAMASFKRYSFNIWSTSTNPWLKEQDWKKCQRDYKPEDLAGRECYAGLDLAQTSDMTALVLLFPWDDGTYRLLPFFWLPKETAFDKDESNPYRGWAEEGLLETTPGNVTDFAFLEAKFGELSKRFKILEVAYDKTYAENLTQNLEQNHSVPRVEFTQTMLSFAGPTSEFERLVIGGKLHHPGHPILNWQAGHVQVYTNANGDKRPVKPRHNERKKIDGIVATVMSLGRANSSDRKGPSKYEKKDLLII